MPYSDRIKQKYPEALHLDLQRTARFLRFLKECNLSPVQAAMSFYQDGPSEAHLRIADLQEAGLLDTNSVKSCPGATETWTGKRLRQEHFDEEISFGQAQEKIRKLIKRVEDLNQNPDVLHRILRITLFGSSLSPRDTGHGDIDLEISLQKRDMTSEEAERLAQIFLERHPKSDHPLSRDDLEELARQDLLEALTANDPYLSIFLDHGVAAKMGLPTQIIYNHPEDHYSV